MRASQRPIAAAQNGFRDQSADANTLAQHLTTGPLPLPLALSYATDVAAALRQLHQQGRAHGWVNTAAVSLASGRAVLSAGNGLRHASPQSDVVGFGAMLLELLTGRKTGTEVPLPVLPAT